MALQPHFIIRNASHSLTRDVSGRKGAIFILFYLRYSFTAISIATVRLGSTVRNFVACATNCPSLQRNPHRSRRRILNRWHWSCLIWAVKNYTQITQVELHDMYAPNVPLSTIAQYLSQNNYRMGQPKNKSKIEDRHEFQKLQQVLEHKHWILEEWEGVNRSDECSVEKSNSGLQMWVFRQPLETWFKDCNAPKWNGKGVSVMFCGLFWGRKGGTYSPRIVKSVKNGVYVKFLEYLLHPVLECVHDNLGHPIFQQ